jgi:hypothetical protein
LPRANQIFFSALVTTGQRGWVLRLRSGRPSLEKKTFRLAALRMTELFLFREAGGEIAAVPSNAIEIG